MRRLAAFIVLLLVAITPPAGLAATTARLPPWVCANTDVIWRSGFESQAAIPHDPSGGSGGAFPGNRTRTVAVAGIGNRTYYVRLPPTYTPARAVPVILVFHGQSGSSANAPAAAQQVRSDWSAIADTAGLAVISLVGNQAQGGWGAAADGPEIEAVLADAFAAYNFERSRIYLWGYSAGAHYAHGIALDNTDYFAAYGVSAGSLEQYACTDDGSYPPTCAALLAGAHPKIPVDIHLGNTDPLYTQYGAGGDPARFEAGGWVMGSDLFYTLFAGGHVYTVQQLGEIWTHLCPFALAP